MDLRYTMRMLGVPLDGPTWLFGDNQAVVNSATIPHSTLSKRWNAISYHRCREAVAAGVIRFDHISGKDNPADILTKPLPYFTAKTHVEPLMFWKGETADIPPPATVPNDWGVSDGNPRGRVPGD